MITNSLGWRLGSTYNWAHIYFTHKKLYSLIFYYNIYISLIIKNSFKKNFFLSSSYGLSYIKNKIFSFFNYLYIFIFFNQRLKLKIFFLRKILKWVSSWKLKKWKKYISSNHRIFFKKLIRFSIMFIFYVPFLNKIRLLILQKLRKLVSNRTKINIIYFFNKSHRIELELIALMIKNLFKKRKSLSYIKFLLKKVFNLMRTRNEISGFKYLFAGRFTRNGRAVYSWEIVSKMPFSSKTAQIEYLPVPLFLRYGSCTIHLWINR